MDLKNHVALITGASRGIGKAVAVRLARDGAKIGVNYHTGKAEAESVVKEIEESGGDAISLYGDVTLDVDVRDIVQKIRDRWDNIDILVNNAGIRRDKILLRLSENDWNAVLDTNLKSAYLCSKAVLPSMVRQRWGRIINMSSVVGLSGNAGQANYAASKAGLIGLTKTIAREVASRNITANALAPGYIVTEMVESLPDDLRDQVLGRIPLGRFGTAADVAGMVAFLCSEEASYVTGQVIGIDGGMAA